MALEMAYVVDASRRTWLTRLTRESAEGRRALGTRDGLPGWHSLRRVGTQMGEPAVVTSMMIA